MWYPILACAIIVKSCMAGSIIEKSRDDKSDYLIKAALKTLKSCYGEQINTVSVAGSTNTNFIRSLFEQSIPATVINNPKGSASPLRRKSVHQLQLFVVSASSPTKLTEILNGVKDSIWWNHLASFIILDWSSESEDKCASAHEMLFAAWKFNLLNAKLMCLHSEREPTIYSFNPFKETAPKPWQLKKTYREQKDHPWTLFARSFQEGEELCKDLDFDKTNDLNGYEIRASVMIWREYWFINVNKTGTDSFGGSFGHLARILCQTLNATCKLMPRNSTSLLIAQQDTLDGLSDMLMFPRSQLVTLNSTMTYPHWQAGLSAATQYSGEVSQLTKLKSVLDHFSRGCVYLVLFVTLLFFKYSLRQSLTPAILNNIRLVCNGSILGVPENQAPRIYLASLFLFVVTIQAVYQGKLAALLTKPVSLPNVNTMGDLINSHHRIYGFKTYATFFTDPIFDGRFNHMESTESCVEQVVHHFSACCVADWYFMFDDVAKRNLYMSRDTINSYYWIYQIRPDWPLEQRVNLIVQRLVQANLVRYWHMKHIEIAIDRTRYHAKLKDDQQFRIITLDQLSFAFVILGVGLAIATAVFSIEVGMNRARLRIENAMRQVKNRLRIKNK